MVRSLIERLKGRRKISEKEVDFARVKQVLEEADANGIDSFDLRHRSHPPSAKYSENGVPFDRTIVIFEYQFKPHYIEGQNETRLSGTHQIYADKEGNERHYLDLFYEMRLLNKSSERDFEPRRTGLISFELK